MASTSDSTRQERDEAEAIEWARKNIPNIKPNELGIRVLFKPEDGDEIEADIIAIHGIGVHPEKAWSHPASKRNWLSDPSMLPAALPKARVISFGYDSVWIGESPVKQTLSDVANKLLRGLVRKRKECPTRPIIFVGTCFGGLVLEMAYTQSAMHKQDYPGVYDSVTGMIFLGTPHSGSSTLHGESQGQGSSPATIFGATVKIHLGLREQPSLLRHVSQDSELLINTVHNFTRNINQRKSPPRLFCFYEQRETCLGQLAGIQTKQTFVVDESSGTLDGHQKEALALDHLGICKFESCEDDHFLSVKNQIIKMRDDSKEILEARSQDKPLALQQLAPPRLETLPFRRENNFLSRKGILQLLDTKLDDSGIVALYGASGIGKTHIAIEYAYRFAQDHVSRKVHWINASSTEQLEQSYKYVASSLQLRDSGSNIVESVCHHLRQGTGGGWLVVLDGLESIPDLHPTAASPSSGAPFHFLPDCPAGCQTLVTTRSLSLANRLVQQKGDLAIEVSSLDEAEATQLLLGKPPKDKDRVESASRVVKRVGQSPVALTLANTYLSIVEKKTTLRQYTETLDAAQPPPTAADVSGAAKAWSVLFDVLRKKHPETAQIMLSISILDLQIIQTSFLAEVSSTRNIHKHIKVLVQHGMVEPCISRATISVTAVTRQCVQAWMRQQSQRSAYEEKALERMAARYPTPEDKQLEKCQAWHPCVLAVLGFEESTDSEQRRLRAKLLFKVAKYRLELGQCPEALADFRGCLALLAQDTRKKAQDLLAKAQEAISQLSEPSEMASTVQNDHSARPGPATTPSAGSWQHHHNQGLALDLPGQHDSAVEHYTVARSQNATASTDPLGTPGTEAQALRLPARLGRASHGSTAAARDTLAAQQLALGPTHAETLATQHAHALALLDHGDFDAARAALQAVYHARRARCGNGHPATLGTLCTLALSYWLQGREGEARMLYRAVLGAQEQSLGKTHADTKTTRRMLREVEQKQLKD